MTAPGQRSLPTQLLRRPGADILTATNAPAVFTAKTDSTRCTAVWRRLSLRRATIRDHLYGKRR